MSQPDKAAFAARLNETFLARTDAGDTAALVLTEVSRAGEDPERPFVLLFLAPGSAALDQRTYEVEHGALGTFELFLVPVGPDPGTRQMRYEAVFN